MDIFHNYGMSLVNKIKSAYFSFENMLFKNHSCISCGKEILDGTKFSLCEKCFAGLEIIKGKVCLKCGAPIPETMNYCGECSKQNYVFDKNISFCFYDDVSSSIVKQLKYSSKKYFAKYIAEMMTENLENFKDIDYLTFVPINKTRYKYRGYNQAEEIAKEISKRINIPVEKLLNKLEGGKNQAELSMKDRFENLKNSFEMSDKTKDMKDKTILIIDDVFTTGTTLNRCSSVLKLYKPKKIITMTFAKTKFENWEWKCKIG